MFQPQVASVSSTANNPPVLLQKFSPVNTTRIIFTQWTVELARWIMEKNGLDFPKGILLTILIAIQEQHAEKKTKTKNPKTLRTEGNRRLCIIGYCIYHQTHSNIAISQLVKPLFMLLVPKSGWLIVLLSKIVTFQTNRSILWFSKAFPCMITFSRRWLSLSRLNAVSLYQGVEFF